MASVEWDFLQSQLHERQNRLQAAIAAAPQEAALTTLLREVDAALDRMNKGTYGLCDFCHEAIEKERLLADPLVCYCIDHLTDSQKRELEEDLGLAARIQRELLPDQDFRWGGWEIHHHWEPHGQVSGDYCDIVTADGDSGNLFFALGDVAGKGVAASMMMTQLHAMFRSLASLDMPLEQMVTLANRVFCENVISGQYATLVCGRASRNGQIEIANVGHWPALVVRASGVERVESVGVPLGMFCTRQYPAQKIQIEPGETLFLYSDGFIESRGQADAEFGIERLAGLLREHRMLAPPALTRTCIGHLRDFAAGTPRHDDLTLMVLRRTG
jgi:sigma-B regulation protein RsbU (phosphoserine phosphatase)